jgi:hypothetical protein
MNASRHTDALALRTALEAAIVVLGQGFLAHPENHTLRIALRRRTRRGTRYVDDLLRVVCRILMVLSLEDRALLHPAAATDAARRHYADRYSLRRSSTHTWASLSRIFRGLAVGDAALGLPPLGEPFSAHDASMLRDAKIHDDALQRVIAALAAVSWRDVRPEALGSAYEGLLGHVARISHNATRFTFAPAPKATKHTRKNTGSFYTPDTLIQTLLDHALEPVLTDAIAKHPGREAQALLSLAIVDPTCGAGHVLLAAARRMASHLARLTQGDEARALHQVVARCLYGVDRNATAVALCKTCLWMECVDPEHPLPSLEARVQHGDALFGAPPRAHEALARDAEGLRRQKRVADRWCAAHVARGRHRFFHWHLQFAEVFSRGGFDAVLGNPPFLNAIERRTQVDAPRLRRALTPEVLGAADVAFRMIVLATRLRRQGGRVGMIQPRTILNTPSMARWRASLTPGGVAMVCAPRDARLFADAQVFVALVVLGDAATCAIGVGDTLDDITWSNRTLVDENWWAATTNDAPSLGVVGTPLCELFSVMASMTAGEAYEVLPYVVDRAEGDAPKLVTTGLIDPEHLRWGMVPCRYLKRDYVHPRVVRAPGMSPSLARRIDQARRPKVLVAGLSARIEAVIDRGGELLGAVSTFTIMHPRDDVTALTALMHRLHEADTTQRFRAELGGNAMGGGNITMKKRWLEALRI